MLEAAQKVRPAQTVADSRTLFSCGVPLKGVDLRVVNPDTAQPCEEGNVGEVWLRSLCVTAGYYNRPEVNERVFKVSTEDPYLLSSAEHFFKNTKTHNSQFIQLHLDHMAWTLGVSSVMVQTRERNSGILS